MKQALIKVVCVTSALALIVAFGSPQVGKRKGGGTSGGGTSSGGSGGGGGTTGSGNSGGGGGGDVGRRNDPPPVRTTSGGGGGTTNGGGNTGGGGWPPNQGGSNQGGTGGRGDSRGGGVGGGGWPQSQGGGVIISGGTQSGLGQRRNGNGGGYGTTNNVVQVGGVKISRPVQVINPGMQRRINDQERVGLVVDGWRNGYHHYDNRWCDDYFNYPFYVFNPWNPSDLVCSPWYYYASCPPYLNRSRIVIINVNMCPSYGWSGSVYRWNQPDFSDRWGRYNDIDYAIQDIVDLFTRHDYRMIDRLVPRDGNVHLYFDGRYGYSVDVRDFYDLYRDGVESVRTTRYEITDVQYNGRGARVLARQEYSDPWGNRNVTYHQYFLVQEGRDWVIREFGTSYYRPY